MPQRGLCRFVTWMLHFTTFFNESGKPEAIFEEVDLNIGDKSLLLTSSVIGHCNGLFCLDLNNNTFGVWNPSLRELRRIPTRHLNNWGELGFGYDHSIQDYKIVLIPADMDSKPQVLCLKSGVSRMIDFPCLESFVMFHCHLIEPGTRVGEMIYWAGYDDNVDPTKTILSFDLVSETFNYCPGPSTCGIHYLEFTEGLNGGLCTVGVDSGYDIIVWSAQHEKDNIGVIKSWSKIFSLSRGIVESWFSCPIDKCCLQSAVTYAGSLLFVVSDGREAKLLAYNLEEKSLRNVKTSLSPARIERLNTYVETLVSIPGAFVINTSKASASAQEKKEETAPSNPKSQSTVATATLTKTRGVSSHSKCANRTASAHPAR